MSKDELYDKLSSIYFLPKKNSNAITHQALKNVASGNYFLI